MRLCAVTCAQPARSWCWRAQAHGGQLVLYPPPAPAPPQQASSSPRQHIGVQGAGSNGSTEQGVHVAPAGGRLVVFESHIEHEVLPAYAHR